MNRLILTNCALVALAACASPSSPTESEVDVDRAFLDTLDASELPITPIENLPAGTITYDGNIGADLQGDSAGSLLGDLTLRVDFDDNRIGGNIRNLNLIDQSGEPDQLLEGRLQIDGFENDGRLNAGAGGQLTAVSIDGQELDADLDLDLRGTVRDDQINGDAVFGTATGTATGDFNLLIDGAFAGRER